MLGRKVFLTILFIATVTVFDKTNCYAEKVSDEHYFSPGLNFYISLVADDIDVMTRLLRNKGFALYKGIGPDEYETRVQDASTALKRSIKKMKVNDRSDKERARARKQLEALNGAVRLNIVLACSANNLGGPGKFCRIYDYSTVVDALDNEMDEIFRKAKSGELDFISGEVKAELERNSNLPILERRFYLADYYRP